MLSCQILRLFLFKRGISKLYNSGKMNNPAEVQPADERNIEIKARVGSDEEFQKRVEIARSLTGTEGKLIPQRDVFFKSQSGRLKLRYLQPPSQSQLVYYDRPDQAGPKLSKFNKIAIDEPETLEKILSQSNGALGELVKDRFLFIHNETRIHLDKVKDLGNFMEFEVCLKPEETIEEGQAVAEELIKIFNIKQEDLMLGAYFDELNLKKKVNNVDPESEVKWKRMVAEGIFLH